MLDERDKKLFRSAWNENAHERTSAFELFYRRCREKGVHFSDIDIVEQGDSIYWKQKEQIELRDRQLSAAWREIDLLRKHVDADTVREIQRVRSIPYRWPDFEALVRQTVYGGKTLPSTWTKDIRSMLKVTPTEMRRWEEGTREIPDTIFHAVRTGDLSLVKLTAKPRLKSTIKWSTKLAGQIIAMWDKGFRFDDIGKSIGFKTQSIIEAVMNNPPPPIDVSENGDSLMSFHEFWYICYELYGPEWDQGVRKLLRLKTTTFRIHYLYRTERPDLPLEAKARLRSEFHRAAQRKEAERHSHQPIREQAIFGT